MPEISFGNNKKNNIAKIHLRQFLSGSCSGVHALPGGLCPCHFFHSSVFSPLSFQPLLPNLNLSSLFPFLSLIGMKYCSSSLSSSADPLFSQRCL